MSYSNNPMHIICTWSNVLWRAHCISVCCPCRDTVRTLIYSHGICTRFQIFKPHFQLRFRLNIDDLKKRMHYQVTKHFCFWFDFADCLSTNENMPSYLFGNKAVWRYHLLIYGQVTEFQPCESLQISALISFC